MPKEWWEDEHYADDVFVNPTDMKIKNWIEFITEEFIDNSESLVDVKMQELY